MNCANNLCRCFTLRIGFCPRTAYLGASFRSIRAKIDSYRKSLLHGFDYVSEAYHLTRLHHIIIVFLCDVHAMERGGGRISKHGRPYCFPLSGRSLWLFTFSVSNMLCIVRSSLVN
jgi:hypothetical protein